jgi:hypothetical protein
VKSPVRENRPPGSVRGAPGNRRPYRDPLDRHCRWILAACLTIIGEAGIEAAKPGLGPSAVWAGFAASQIGCHGLA